MPTGTTLNNVFAARIHKHNAAEEREEAESMIRFFRDRMLVLAAMTPMNIDEGDGVRDWGSYVLREIDGAFEELGYYYVRSFLAGQIEDFPEDCIDELENENNREVSGGTPSAESDCCAKD